MKPSLRYEPSTRQVVIVCVISLVLAAAHLARSEGFSKPQAISLIGMADDAGRVTGAR